MGNRHPLWAELLFEQAPIVVTVLGLAVAASYLQHGFLVGGDRPFPLAGIKVPLWHLLWPASGPATRWGEVRAVAEGPRNWDSAAAVALIERFRREKD